VTDTENRRAASPVSFRRHRRAYLAEFLGTAGLVAIVVGSGIAAARLAPGETGLQLLAGSIATALGLAVLIAVFQPISGSHFNPAVTLALLDGTGARPSRQTWGFIASQCLGALAGVAVASAMFAEALAISSNQRATAATVLAEVVATMGLVLVILVLVRTGRANLVGPAVGAYIGAAYWFTSSTAFANPAVTLARVFTESVTGIAPVSALWFVAAQLAGAGCALLLVRALVPAASSQRATT
jgi:glycerol uptake facilitator-like aquaporin